MKLYSAILMIYIAYSIFVKLNVTNEIKPQKKNNGFIIFIILTSLVLRLSIAYSTLGYEVDMNCFKAWGTTAYKVGLSNFYNEISFCDYPPLYIYVLSFLAFIGKVFQIPYDSQLFNLLIKVPPILFDIFIIVFFYLFGLKTDNKKEVKPFCFLLILSPTMIGTSSMWGQIDSVLTFLLILSFYYSINKKLELSALFFTLGALTKPQAFLFAPLMMVMFAFSDQVMFQNLFGLIKTKSKKITILSNYILTFLFSSILMFLVALPFKGFGGISWLISLYKATLSSYAYATINALNLNFLFGGNWVPIDKGFLFLNYSIWSNIFIVLSVVIAILALLKAKDKRDLFFISAVMLFSIFVLAAKMHERYFYPVLILLLIAYIIKRDYRIFYLFSFTTITYFINLTLAYTNQKDHINKTLDLGIFISFLNILILIYCYWIVYESYFQKKKKKELIEYHFNKNKKITRIDILCVTIITLFYLVIAFTNLGDMKAPYTNMEFFEGDQFKIQLDQGYNVKKLMINQGLYLGEVDILINENQISKKLESVFKWHEVEINQFTDEITFTFKNMKNEHQFLNEIGIYDQDSELLIPAKIYYNNELLSKNNLFDEQDLVPQYYHYTNSTYFDEIYHARTAYEFIYNLHPYENTHPHLGKIIISLGIRIFGMNPFGYRVMGTLFGVLMLPFLYLFLKRLFQNTLISVFGTLLLTFDFMHFTQTRIATIDTFIVFFILVMFYYMYRFYDACVNEEGIKKQALMLALSGLFFGLGISSKWTGAYAGAGLCIIYILALLKLEKSYLKKHLVTLFSCGVVFFVMIPFAIYFVSFIPYFKGCNDPINLDSFIRANVHMFEYHSQLVDTHPFASPWYEWIFDIRPIWFYVGTGEKASTIASFGNPLIWLSGFAAILFLFIKSVKNDQKALFILIGYLAQLLPWVFVPRSMFIYHYFSSTIFLVLAITYCGNELIEKKGINKKSLWVLGTFTALACILFVLYYPVLSGFDVPKEYIDELKIFPIWTF